MIVLEVVVQPLELLVLNAKLIVLWLLLHRSVLAYGAVWVVGDHLLRSLIPKVINVLQRHKITARPNSTLAMLVLVDTLMALRTEHLVVNVRVVIARVRLAAHKLVESVLLVVV